jgi:hypothetical protein
MELPEYGIGNQYVFVAIKDSAIDLGKFHRLPNSLYQCLQAC